MPHSARADCAPSSTLIAPHSRASWVEGGLVYDVTSKTLKTCDGTNWQPVADSGGGMPSCTVEGSILKWRSGAWICALPSYTSCKHILDNGDSIGDGLYIIDADGPTGPELPFNVWCDMTTDGGGWTLVAHKQGTASALFTTAAVGTLTSPTQTTSAKLSDAVWNSMIATDGTLITIQCMGEGKGNLWRTSSGNLNWSSTTVATAMQGRALPGSYSFSAGDSNTYCGGTQVATNWSHSNMYGFRWNSAGGCSYIDNAPPTTLAMPGCPSGSAYGGYLNAWVR